jgi:hypothetical protein
MYVHRCIDVYRVPEDVVLGYQEYMLNLCIIMLILNYNFDDIILKIDYKLLFSPCVQLLIPMIGIILVSHVSLLIVI